MNFKHEEKYQPCYFNLILPIYVERFLIIVFIEHTPTEMGPFMDKYSTCGRESFGFVFLKSQQGALLTSEDVPSLDCIYSL